MVKPVLERLNPYQTVVLLFLLFIFGGAGMLMLHWSSTNHTSLSFIDALFTSTSATAVTGLIVKNTAEYFSWFGQLVIIFLIQIGGLGIMTMSTLFVLLLGKKLKLKELMVLQEEMNMLSLKDIFHLTKLVALVTFIVEGVGGTILGVYWSFSMGWKGLYFGYWHAISAFCNAGFDLFGNSLMNYSGDYVVNIVITTLIILGGLGFIPIYEIYKHRKWRRFSLHTKIVIVVTLLLILIGMVMFYLSEYSNPITMGNMPLHQKLLASYFQSVTTRTAGFNTIDLTGMYSGALFLMIVLMFIGASPGSVGGGIKTTTAAILFLTMKSMMRGDEQVNVFRKRLPQGAINRAVMLLLISAWLLTLSVLVLLHSDSAGLLVILFETVSAYATVGLTLDYTVTLSEVGKVCIMIMMFIGRVGPITLMMALFSRSTTSHIKYPKASVVVG